MRNVTLLAPARDLSVGLAAIQAGADAVYIGASKYGAREKAGNSVEDIAKLAQAAAVYGVQVLVTLNILVTNEERRECIAMAEELWGKGVYAFIVQDEELARELIARGMRVHASTQMDNRTVEDVQARRDMGCKRVVLARELSIDEIRKIREAVPDIELEAFVHGAVCVCYSGRCTMSEKLMGRSANRGACAQMCRMRYDLLDEEGNEVKDDMGRPIHQRYLLSMQDMDRSGSIRELAEAGVTTLKIEGRLKDADYVTNVVAYYRGLLDRLYPSEEQDQYRYDFTPDPEKTFHRGGQEYFLHGRTEGMANMLTPKSTGERIGTIAAAARPGRKEIILQPDAGITLHNGDGLSIGDAGCNVNGTRAEKGLLVVATSAEMNVKGGETVYRNLDVAFVRHLHAERHIPVDIRLEQTDRGYRLTMKGAGAERTQEFESEHIAAENPEKARQTAKTQLSKLGDTRYVARTIAIETEDFIPAGRLNEWRRALTY